MRYSVIPSQGMILPGQSQRIEIVLLPVEHPPSHKQLSDRFLVQSAWASAASLQLRAGETAAEAAEMLLRSAAEANIPAAAAAAAAAAAIPAGSQGGASEPSQRVKVAVAEFWANNRKAGDAGKAVVSGQRFASRLVLPRMLGAVEEVDELRLSGSGSGPGSGSGRELSASAGRTSIGLASGAAIGNDRGRGAGGPSSDV